MLWQKRGTHLECVGTSHATAQMMEEYALGRLEGPALAPFEEHLLCCQQCQNRLAMESAFTQGMRDAMKMLEQKAAAPSKWTFEFWPKSLVALGMAAAFALLIFGGLRLPFWRGKLAAPAVVLLQAARGGASPWARAHQPLTLDFDVTDLPQLAAYDVAVVDVAGHPAFQSKAVPRNEKLQADLSNGLSAGVYFVRLYGNPGELLREYALAVHR